MHFYSSPSLCSGCKSEEEEKAEREKDKKEDHVKTKRQARTAPTRAIMALWSRPCPSGLA